MPIAPGSPRGEQYGGTHPPPRNIGDSISGLRWTDHSGREMSIADFRGSPVVLVLHASHWDPAATDHVASYNRVIARLGGAAGARLLSINGNGTWRELDFNDTSLRVPVLSSDTDDIAAQLGVSGGPAVFVVDGEGVIRWKHVAGEALPSTEQLGRALAAIAPAPQADSHGDDHGRRAGLTRREFVATAFGASIALALLPITRQANALAQAAMSPGTTAAPAAPSTAQPVTLDVNGRALQLNLEPRVSLLDALREYAELTGTKKGCDHGQCGACTVHIDGRRHLSCLTFAIMHQGKKITTVEGLARGTELHPMQEAFLRHDGFQCGYCTPGQLMSATAVVREPWGPTDADVREAMSGNICRCGAYTNIVAAVQEVRNAHAASAATATKHEG